MTSAADPCTVSVVTPVYDEGDNVAELVRQLRELFATLEYRLEVVIVDDGSGPRTVAVIDRLCAEHDEVAALHLSRNFGHQAALAAGLEAARGDAVIVMDSDLQHPVRVIPELLARWAAGAEIVYTVRRRRADAGLFKRLTAGLFYTALNRLSETPVPADAADYRLVSRRVIDELLALPERARFWRGLVQWVGFDKEAVYFETDLRLAGHSKYDLRRMVSLGIDGLLSMSTLPLRFALYLGALVSLSGFAYAGYVAVAYFTEGRAIRGWSSLIVAMLVIGGVQLLVLGIIGLYVGRLYDEVKRRPTYLVKRRSGWLA